MNEAIKHIKNQIDRGIITLKEDGTFWKNAKISAHGDKMTPIEPRRMEVALSNGYLGVNVWENGKQYLATAHRAVWSLMVGEIPQGMDINHKDGNKHNNRPQNLEIVTRSENIKHAYQNGLNPRTDFARDYSARAKALRKRGLSYSQIAKALKISSTTAYRAEKYK